MLPIVIFKAVDGAIRNTRRQQQQSHVLALVMIAASSRGRLIVVALARVRSLIYGSQRNIMSCTVETGSRSALSVPGNSCCASFKRHWLRLCSPSSMWKVHWYWAMGTQRELHVVCAAACHTLVPNHGVRRG